MPISAQHLKRETLHTVCVCVQELEEVLHQAREAQDLVAADDYFEDNNDDVDEMAETLTENSFIKS